MQTGHRNFMRRTLGRPDPGAAACRSGGRLEQGSGATRARHGHRRTPRTTPRITLLVTLALAAGLVPLRLQAETRASIQQVREAWLAADAVVYGKYRGVSATAGEPYHEIDADEVWIGTPVRGPVLFKAPRGIQAEPGDQVLLMLWDELNGSTHAYLEKAQRLYGEDLWKTIGPDSVTPYLLPFSRFAFRFEKGRIDLRGTNIFGASTRKRDLRRDLEEYESTLTPAAQARSAEVIAECRVEEREFKFYEVDQVPVELRVFVQFHTNAVHKGEIPESFSIEYGSFPRSPRFEKGETVLLFLSQREGSWFLINGKRSVYHVSEGKILETGQPVREFLKALQGP